MPADVRPPYDAELAAALTVISEQMPPTITPDMIEIMRTAPITEPVETVLEGRSISHREVTVPGHEGADITLSVFARDGRDAAGPGIYHTHGGGMIFGDRFTGIEVPLDWVERFDAVCVSVEYRLAPEFPDPYLVEDCYAGLRWTAEHAAELGMIRAGWSSPAAARAAGSPPEPRCSPVTGTVRRWPARFSSIPCSTTATRQSRRISSRHRGVGPRQQRDRLGRPIWASGSAPMTCRSTRLRPGPPTCPGCRPPYIDVASAEVFRDEAVAYASQIWADGGVAELHVWPGGFHGFDLMAPEARISREAIAARTNWVARQFGA